MIPVWQGFDFSWDKAPHRLNELTSVTDGESVRHAFTVGRVPDTGTAKSWVTRLEADGVRATHGISTVLVRAELGDLAAGQSPRVRLPVQGSGSAILRGFSLKCESCEVGLHTRGFGLDLEDMQLEDGHLSFTPTAWVHAANSPDLITGGRGSYSYALEIAWSALDAEDGAASFSSGDPIVHRHRGAPEEVIGEMADASTPHAVLGLRGLAVRQSYSGRFRRDGRFIRRIQAGVDDLERFGERARYRPHLHFTNRGVITYPVEIEQRLHTTLIGFASGTSSRQRVQTRIRTGIGEGGRAVEKLS